MAAFTRPILGTLNMLLCFLLLLSVCFAADVGTFTYPSGTSGGTEMTLGSKVTIRWTGTGAYSSLSLGMHSSSDQNNTWLISNSKKHETSWDWTVNSYDFNTKDSINFKFIIVNGTKSGLKFESPFFLIKGTSATPTSTPTPAGKHGGLGVAAKVGIAIGLGLVGLIIILLVAWFVLRRHQKKKNSVVPQGSVDENLIAAHEIKHHPPESPYQATPVSKPPVYYPPPPAELHAVGIEAPRSELDAAETTPVFELDSRTPKPGPHYTSP